MPPIVYRRQRDLLEFISQYMQKKGYAPTLAEICDGLGLRSPATVHEHIQNLIEKGILKKTEGARRGLEIVDQKVMGWIPSGVEVPIMGRIAAGSPIEAINDPTATITVPEDMVGKKRSYVLQVKGNSMIEAAILDGDYVLIEQTETANNGEIVVALLNENFTTLKRYYKEADHIRLEPANSTMSPIIVRGNIKIQGIVKGVIRKFN
jgi:repressor LexA